MPAKKSFRHTPQAELRIAANYIVIEFKEPLNPEDLEAIRDAIHQSPPITPEVNDAYIAYDNGFGQLVRTEPKGA